MDAATAWRMVRGMPRQGTHQERLAGFYAPQADRYDAVREQLLHGRDGMMAAVAERLPDGAAVAEIGCGTGRNLEGLAPHLDRLGPVWAVDLCPPLLAKCRERIAARGWPRVEAVEADATVWTPPRPLDAVLFSYSLTMIPPWRAALDRALANLRPGGVIGVVDFWVSGADGADPERHGAWTRWFWPRWFRHDGVHLGPDRLRALRAAVTVEDLHTARGRIPGLGLSVPWFRLVGRVG
jgi:S-adenosylmethionine-diacylgycerolhomoserine-N-methlytransferase